MMKIKNNEIKFSKKNKNKKLCFTTKKNSKKFFEPFQGSSTVIFSLWEIFNRYFQFMGNLQPLFSVYGKSSTVIFSFLKNNSYIWRLKANVVYVDQ